MAFELIFTSVPKGLRPGSFGYCTVARHESMPDNLVSELEKLSGFDLPPGIEKVETVYSFFTLERPTGKYWILSRKRACDRPDYSGRGNYIAHHLIFSDADVEYFCTKNSAVTPESILFTYHWRDEFDGEPELLSKKTNLEAIWTAAQNISYDYPQLCQESHGLQPPDSSLFEETLEPKTVCVLSSELCTDTGSRKVLSFFHQAKLLTSPWRGEYCGENLFEGSAFPVNPHSWWDAGITTMLVYNDNASRYRWIGTTDQRVGSSGNRSRLVINFDRPSSDPQGPHILTRFATDPETFIAEPEKIRSERSVQAANDRIGELITTAQSSFEQWQRNLAERNAALEQVANAVAAAGEQKGAMLQRIQKLKECGYASVATLRQRFTIAGVGLETVLVAGANRLEEQLKQFLEAHRRCDNALIRFGNVAQECKNGCHALHATFADVDQHIKQNAGSLANSQNFLHHWGARLEHLRHECESHVPQLTQPANQYNPQEAELALTEAQEWLSLIRDKQAAMVRRGAERHRLYNSNKRQWLYKIALKTAVLALIVGLACVAGYKRRESLGALRERFLGKVSQGDETHPVGKVTTPATTTPPAQPAAITTPAPSDPSEPTTGDYAKAINAQPAVAKPATGNAPPTIYFLLKAPGTSSVNCDPTFSVPLQKGTKVRHLDIPIELPLSEQSITKGKVVDVVDSPNSPADHSSIYVSIVKAKSVAINGLKQGSDEKPVVLWVSPGVLLVVLQSGNNTTPLFTSSFDEFFAPSSTGHDQMYFDSNKKALDFLPIAWLKPVWQIDYAPDSKHLNVLPPPWQSDKKEKLGDIHWQTFRSFLLGKQNTDKANESKWVALLSSEPGSQGSVPYPAPGKYTVTLYLTLDNTPYSTVVLIADFFSEEKLNKILSPK